MKEDNSRFNLTGLITDDAPYGCEIKLTTPDGRVTKLESGRIYRTASEAEASLKENLDRIIREFTKNGEVEVVGKDGVNYQ